MKNNLLKKFLSFSIGGYVNAVIGFFMLPFITRILTPEEYGIASLIAVLVDMLVIMCSMGLDQGLVRFFYEEDEDNRGRLLYNSISYPIIFFFILSIILFIFKDKITFFILNKNDNFLWKVILVSILFRILHLFSILIIRMQQKGKLFSFFNILLKVSEFLFILILYKIYKNSYKILILASLFSFILTSLLSIFFERKIWTFSGKEKITKKELLKYSFPLVLTMGLTWLFASADKLTIKYFSDLNQVGLYSSSFKIVSIISVIQSGFTTFWTPIVYEHYSKNPEDTLFYKKANDYLSIIFFSMGLGILIFRDLIVFLLGDKYYLSKFIIPMLIFIPVMYLISETTVMGISFKKKSKYFLYISIVVSITNILGNIILVPFLGAKGAAISTGVSYILFFALRTYFSNKLINFNFNLKRIYFIIILILGYALFLTFYDNIFLNIGIGILLQIIIIVAYFPILKELYFKYIKKRGN
ncbi:lipopolysaccharide biosynthesis protein [Fusobacterium periodonticum]|uniref:lipopolysaccharide biosynthesis protein n=1 Tax=Fusobacterium periodonticum TaxID=860 RepID=UPI0019577A9B|nr:oligosaccharide flippase family protein [Fusobacterium periodonticum]VTX62395.1 Polysaccharide biosynthesis protein [Fusobacterium periodonticum]